MDGDVYIRAYQKAVHPVDKWLFRIDQQRDSKMIPVTNWIDGGYSKDACLSKAKLKCADLKISEFEIIIENH